MTWDMRISKLTYRTFFDSLVVKVENLMYELSMYATPGKLISRKWSTAKIY